MNVRQSRIQSALKFDTKLLNGALINGEWLPGSAGTFAVKSPHSGDVLHEVGRCSAGDAQRAVQAARAAFPTWAALSVVERAEIMRNMHRLFVERADKIAHMVTAEVAKPIMAAREETFEYSAPAWGKAAEEALRHRGMLLPSTQEKSNNKRLVLGHRPLGVLGLITPYNFPTDISSIALAHAAVAGNTIVWKPTEYAPVACAMVAEMFAEAGFPDGVINVVQGYGDVGAAIVDDKDVKGIFFTGSTATGERIARVNPLRPMLLELGGDGPLIVLEDADIDAAVEGAIVGAFYYSGQVCTSSERLLVHAAVYDEFMAKFRKATAALKMGDPFREDTDLGPLCNEGTLNRAREHVADARAKGAAVEQFGKENGLYFPATIITNSTRDMLVRQKESFSPIATVVKVASAEDAIAIANESELGLVASLWSKDLAKAWRVAEALPHGTVNVNETSNYWDQLAPFGGAGKSGVGRELSQWFLDSFTEKKLISFDLGGPRADRRVEGGW
jgi:succinate-semialdehyde dehydrogenase / glutarate-semialdehyde dehydrogenase